MLFSVLTPIIVLLLAAVASYAITRPIGDMRRHIAAVLLSLTLGFIGGVIGGVLHEAAYETAFMIAVSAAIAGACIGMAIAWRRRHPVGNPQSQSRPRWHSTRRRRYGISRA